ncbi:MAG: UDP-N-acetylmuramoyl-L-alanine--D-glutamate ligase [Hyphomicrobiales bacterium]
MIPVTVFNGQTVAVFGLGRSGLATISALAAGGARVVAWDDNEAARGAAAALGAEIADLSTSGFSEFAALILAPGVPLTHPEPHWTVKRAQAAGIEIIGDTELLARQLAAENSGAKLVAITGTNGKSTTTALLGHVLKEGGLTVEIGGNIGTAVLALAPPAAHMIYVLEFSSYQIDLTPGLHADVAILLNISPDHLDRHGDLETYAAVKARVFDGQVAGDSAIIGTDDDLCRRILQNLAQGPDIEEISGLHPVRSGIFAADGKLYRARDGAERMVADLGGVVSLRGDHNGQNAAAAFAAAHALGLAPETIAAGLRTFPGLAHRMEQVGQKGEVLFINDSKATNADAAARALASFDRIYWIAGGLAKAGGIQNLKEFFPKIVKAYLIGDAASDFAGTLEGAVAYEMCGTVERATMNAAGDAAADLEGESAVLFSPACASFDQFRNFELRGDAFRTAVHAVPGVAKSEGT